MQIMKELSAENPLRSLCDHLVNESKKRMAGGDKPKAGAVFFTHS
jgi:hypothetical protein